MGPGYTDHHAAPLDRAGGHVSTAPLVPLDVEVKDREGNAGEELSPERMAKVGKILTVDG